MAEIHAPDQLSRSQARLLEMRPQLPTPRLRALIADELDVQTLYDIGFTRELTPSDLEFVRDPSHHPRLPKARYPLRVGELAILSGATERQIRHWADAAILPSYRVGGERRFFEGACIRALVLARVPQPEVTAVTSVARGGTEGSRLMRFLGDVLVSRAHRHPDPEHAHAVFGAVSTLTKWLETDSGGTHVRANRAPAATKPGPARRPRPAARSADHPPRQTSERQRPVKAKAPHRV
jgi:hypothetical protein